MARSRRDIIPYDNFFAHCTWRCLNREFLLTNETVKRFIVNTWVRFKDRYGVRIYDFCILDNHVHMLLQCASVEKLGDFMRVCNSLVARFINKLLHRDSHALRERYKSPLITSSKYLLNTIKYIWLNYYKATGQKPQSYRHGSAYFRAQGLSHKVLSSYADLPIDLGKSETGFAIDLLNAAMSDWAKTNLVSSIYEHSHTIGSYREVSARTEALRRPRRDNYG